jgi:hypothetical protein
MIFVRQLAQPFGTSNQVAVSRQLLVEPKTKPRAVTQGFAGVADGNKLQHTPCILRRS